MDWKLVGKDKLGKVTVSCQMCLERRLKEQMRFN